MWQSFPLKMEQALVIPLRSFVVFPAGWEFPSESPWRSKFKPEYLKQIDPAAQNRSSHTGFYR